ncbi:MAG: pyruvate, phosphate dikinase [Elusimicrobiota bacterium]
MMKSVYLFAKGKAEGKAGMKEILGGKGANLAEMTNLGIPVPPGFTISTEECLNYYRKGKKLTDSLKREVIANLKKVEKVMGKKYAAPADPLLFSVRSGARVSMPGMMDTVLNLGLNEKVVEGLAKKTGNARFAWDSYRRFIQMYSNVVMGLPGHVLEHVLDKKKKARGVRNDTELTVDDLRDIVKSYLPLVKQKTGKPFPTEPMQQLWGAISAVFGSWNIPRAVSYRRLHKIPDTWGTAVNVQSMVFGNKGEGSATGVAFTRDPGTGERKFFGEFLTNAQGEDVVAGIRTPQPINRGANGGSANNTLEDVLPKQYKQLEGIYHRLERHYKEMQDIEFTIEEGTLWMLQTRTGKRTAQAAIRIACEMVDEGLINEKQAVLRVQPDQLDQLLHPTLDPKAPKTQIAKGLAASPGAASGKAVFTAEQAVEEAHNGEKVILVRLETSPEDIEGMAVAQAILTARGGKTSHAAVVARGMGKCCVCGCNDITVKGDSFTTEGGKTIKKGDWITLDGSVGFVYEGRIPTTDPELDKNFHRLMGWADKIRRLGVRTNADTPKDSKAARDFGAEGIGLTRTEHMFFEGERIMAVREMILSANKAGRERALKKLIKHQRNDFKGILKAMEGLPVTIRLLDPPLHEFLPQEKGQIQEVAKTMGVPYDTLVNKIQSLHELNPMLGHRGCRLGIVYPEITRMQARAIFEATAELTKKKVKVLPEVMVPLTGTVEEMDDQAKHIHEVAAEVKKETGVNFKYMVGTMIEIPRAAITAAKVAKSSEFFSFGTNDLTQMTYGYSRDDAGKFLPYYVQHKILPADPFQTVDQEGVGFLMKHAVIEGRKTRPKLKCGICGEHGGDPESVIFCHNIGLDYVSCSPFRVPIARLAAAHAVLREEAGKKATAVKKGRKHRRSR